MLYHLKVQPSHLPVLPQHSSNLSHSLPVPDPVSCWHSLQQLNEASDISAAERKAKMRSDFPFWFTIKRRLLETSLTA